jgi:hypothetical protein
MPTRPSKKRHNQLDPVELARSIVDQVTGDAPKEAPPDPYEGKNQAAVALGRLGGSKGGKSRAAKLTAERRAEIAKRAASARWNRRSAERIRSVQSPTKINLETTHYPSAASGAPVSC